MTKVTGMPQNSRAVMEQPTPDTQDGKMKTSYQPRSKKCVKVAMEPWGWISTFKKRWPGKLLRSSTSKKLKKTRGSKLCSQCSKVNEELNQDKAEEVTEIVESPAIPARPVGSQWLQSTARDFRSLQGSRTETWPTVQTLNLTPTAYINKES